VPARVQTGTIVSGVGHGVLILWVLFGGLFLREREVPVATVAEVSMISEEDFAALTAPPSVATETETPEPPVADAAPDSGPAPETAPETSLAPVAETAPEPLPRPVEMAEPETPDSLDPPAPDPSTEVAALPEAPPKPRPSPRIAPELAPEPPPDAQIADAPVPEVAPSEEPAAVVEEERPPAAPEEAAPEIVTEAEDPSPAPETSIRPRSRPARRPVAVAEAPPEAPTEQETEEQPQTAALDAALAEAMGGDEGQGTAEEAPARPTGPPLTAGEKGDFALAVRKCWVVDPGSEASRVIVSIRFELLPDGTVAGGSLQMVASTEGSDAAVQTAFDSARRAILRCGAQGYDLPPEKYEQWKLVTINFDPNDVRMR
jgi:hypothetical protein